MTTAGIEANDFFFAWWYAWKCFCLLFHSSLTSMNCGLVLYEWQELLTWCTGVSVWCFTALRPVLTMTTLSTWCTGVSVWCFTSLRPVLTMTTLPTWCTGVWCSRTLWPVLTMTTTLSAWCTGVWCFRVLRPLLTVTTLSTLYTGVCVCVCVVFQNSLTSANYDNFVNLVTTEITVQLEKAVGKTTFNRVSFSCQVSFSHPSFHLSLWVLLSTPAFIHLSDET